MLRLPLLAASLILVLNLGCKTETSSTVTEHTIGQLLVSDSISMVLLPIRKEWSSGEAVQVAYLLHNPGDPRRIRLQPEQIGFEVVGPNGKLSSRVTGYEVPPLGDVPDLTLGTNGLAGGIVDLSCYRVPYEPRALQRPSDCIWQLELSEPGQYAITGIFSWPVALDTITTRFHYRVVRSAPIVIHIAQ